MEEASARMTISQEPVETSTKKIKGLFRPVPVNHINIISQETEEVMNL